MAWLTKHSMFLTLGGLAADDGSFPSSNGSCIELWILGGVIFCVKKDPAVGVWLLDRDLADLIIYKQMREHNDQGNKPFN